MNNNKAALECKIQQIQVFILYFILWEIIYQIMQGFHSYVKSVFHFLSLVLTNTLFTTKQSAGAAADCNQYQMTIHHPQNN